MSVEPHRHSFEAQVHAFIEEEGLLRPRQRLVVGVSGGVDSVVLLEVLVRLGYETVVAHVNYGLRDKDADQDEVLVRRLCSERDIPCRVLQAGASGEESSVQEWARAVRYRFFEEVAGEEDCDRVAVAHQKDDQAETVLHHLIRGSGPEGLAGMPARRSLSRGSRVQLVRPLLWARREAIEAYARGGELPWRTDATNRSAKYLRGRLRTRVLPCLEEEAGGPVIDAIVRSADLLRAYVEHDLRPALRRHFEACAAEESGEGSLAADYLHELPPVWRRRLILEALRRWLPEAPRRSSVLEEAEALLESQPGRRIELKGGVIWRGRSALRFVSAAPEQEEVIVEAGGRPVQLAAGALVIELIKRRPKALDTGSANEVYIDAEAISWPLRARPWRAGDRFQPLGMEGTKKVSELLTDSQVPPHRKQQAVVLADKEGIVWVVGQRLADRARVRPDSARFAKITYNPRHKS